MTARRRLLIAVGRVGLAGAAVVALPGCERPAPIVTVFSGATSEWKEADVFCFEGQSLAAENCAERQSEVPQIRVVPGERVGVDVSKDVVERGWYLELTDPEAPATEPQGTEVMSDVHYFAFTAPRVGEGGLRLTILTMSEDGRQPSGRWSFDLVPR